LLVLDDELEVARPIQRALALKGYEVTLLRTADEIASFIDHPTDEWDAILLDVGLGELNGLDVLAQLRDAGLRTAIVMLTADQTATTATAALRGGAFHYLTKPTRMDELYDVVRLAVQRTRITRDLARAQDPGGAHDLIVGRSATVSALRRTVTRVAASDVGVLVTGESGTGKELVARALHQQSARRDKPFVPINCGAIPEGLIDSELFGHTRGAFTGATAARPGVFVEADGGTLFLDEIGDMPLAVQARLLRTLQEGEVRAVGGDGTRPVDVRVVAATHVDLDRAVQVGRFRADLYFRLNVVSVKLPPLREHPEDIPDLIARFIQRRAGATRPDIDESALAALTQYTWPGNVRELENAIIHALAMSHGQAIDLASLPSTIIDAQRRPRIGVGSVPVVPIDPDVPLPEARRRAQNEFERGYLLRILEQAKGSISSAARTAGVDRTNFRRLLQRHGIDPTRFKQ
jgi:two-component system response regulator HydG